MCVYVKVDSVYVKATLKRGPQTSLSIWNLGLGCLSGICVGSHKWSGHAEGWGLSLSQAPRFLCFHNAHPLTAAGECTEVGSGSFRQTHLAVVHLGGSQAVYGFLDGLLEFSLRCAKLPAQEKTFA